MPVVSLGMPSKMLASKAIVGIVDVDRRNDVDCEVLWRLRKEAT